MGVVREDRGAYFRVLSGLLRAGGAAGEAQEFGWGPETPRAVIEKFATMQMVEVHLPVSDGRRLQMERYTQPGRDLELPMTHMGLHLPPQPPPRISATGQLARN